MPGFFYHLGRSIGPKLRKGKWVWDSLTASPEQIIAAEYDVGRDMAAAVSQQMPLDTDRAAVDLVADLGRRLASRLTNPHRRWAFHLVQADAANAWALPGGFIFITRSLLDLCNRNADEIAFILSHEMGHVVHKDAFDRLAASTLLTAASAASPVGRLMMPKVIQVGTRLMQAAYTQDQELEADKFGLQLTASASLDPAAAIRTMERLHAKHADQLPEFLAYFSTHPPFPTRIAQIRRMLAAR